MSMLGGLKALRELFGIPGRRPRRTLGASIGPVPSTHWLIRAPDGRQVELVARTRSEARAAAKRALRLQWLRGIVVQRLG